MQCTASIIMTSPIGISNDRNVTQFLRRDWNLF